MIDTASAQALLCCSYLLYLWDYVILQLGQHIGLLL